MPTEKVRDGMSREVAGQRWSLVDVIAHFDTHGTMPFPLAGGEGEGDDDAADAAKGGDAKSGTAGSGKDDGKGGDAGKDGGEDVSGLKSALAKTRDDNKTLKGDLKAIRDELDAIKNAGKSETEKIAADRDRLAKQLETVAAKQRDAAGREAVRAVAKRLGAPEDKRDLVYRAVKSDLTFNDDGEPDNVDVLVADMKNLYPDQFRPTVGKGDGGTGRNGKPDKQDMNSVLREAMGRSG